MGNWVDSRNRKPGAFPLKEFVRKLGRKAIVIMGNEHCTSALCTVCGSENRHPCKAGGTTQHRGTVQCVNKDCPAQRRFLNRDVAAAASMPSRFVCKFLRGGELGKVSSWV